MLGLRATKGEGNKGMYVSLCSGADLLMKFEV